MRLSLATVGSGREDGIAYRGGMAEDRTGRSSSGPDHAYATRFVAVFPLRSPILSVVSLPPNHAQGPFGGGSHAGIALQRKGTTGQLDPRSQAQKPQVRIGTSRFLACGCGLNDRCAGLSRKEGFSLHVSIGERHAPQMVASDHLRGK